MGGGGKGAHYLGFAQAGVTLNFYENLKSRVGSFAWGYKFFENDGVYGSIRNKMMGSYCSKKYPNGEPLKCDKKDIGDWKYFLSKIMGFNDLEELIRANKSNYRSLANVVFVGDSSDTINEMVEADGPLPSYRALAALFQKASKGTGGAFLGKHMIDAFGGDDGYVGKENSSCPGQNLMTVLATDAYKSGIVVKPMTATFNFWSQWPVVPEVTAKLELKCLKNAEVE